MPRIAPDAIRRARVLQPHLAKLLPVCKDLRSAQNELRWIRERVHNNIKDRLSNDRLVSVPQLVRRRSQGEPLQYILGTEYFGDLELRCKPGVLIPRLETAASVTCLVSLIAARLKKEDRPPQLHVLDLCTGTGCIPLLFHDEFYKHSQHKTMKLEIKGYDISQDAIDLARDNLSLQLEQKKTQPRYSKQPSARHESLHNMEFLYYDVLRSGFEANAHPPNTVVRSDAHTSASQTLPAHCDIFISNPPYISPRDYMRTTARSVRQFEPKLALVPPATNRGKEREIPSHDEWGDLFYHPLLNLAERLSAKLILLEVANMAQAKRVVAMVLQRTTWNIGVEIWRDEPAKRHTEDLLLSGRAVNVIGEGNGRSVFIWRRDCDVFGSAPNREDES